MLTKVEVSTNLVGTKLVLPLIGTNQPFLIKDIEGLDPVKANIVSSSFSTLDGTQYQSSRRESRTIIFKLGLDISHGPIKLLRKFLYRYLMPKSVVSLRFHDSDGTYVDISGMVETCVVPLFAEEPEATISVFCFDSDFYTPMPVVVEGATTFTEKEVAIDYDGDVESGVKLRMVLNRIIDNFKVYHRLPDQSIRILEFNSTLIHGDVLEISTVSGNKFAYRLRAGKTDSVLDGITPFSSWLELAPGLNHIRVYSKGMPLPYTIDYTSKYGGL